MSSKNNGSLSNVDDPSTLARYTCAGISCAIFGIWLKFTFVPESETPGRHVPMHSFVVPLVLTLGYLVSLPVLKYFVENYLTKSCNVKVLLKESMVLYNIAQVVLNGWMVWRFLDALLNRNHPFIGDITTTSTGTTYIIWVHYCDKYLEFFDTYFMVLRGRMDQVSFLHVYHHFSIVWAWWAAMNLMPGGDSYFGALLNSWIHVLMYGYYALSLLKIPCPWKKMLTQAQLLQFTSVVAYSICCLYIWPEDHVEAKHRICVIIQIWEMVSLFVLFSLFYRKSYRKRADPSVDSKVYDDQQCEKAVVEGVLAVESAAKDASKLASNASIVLNETANPVKSRAGKTWSMAK